MGKQSLRYSQFRDDMLALVCSKIYESITRESIQILCGNWSSLGLCRGIDFADSRHGKRVAARTSIPQPVYTYLKSLGKRSPNEMKCDALSE